MQQPTSPLSTLQTTSHSSGVRTTAMVIIAVVAAAFALFLGREFFIPILFAVLLNALFRPAVRLIERFKLPTPIAAAIVVLSLIALLCAGGFALSGPVQRWVNEAPDRFNAAEKRLDKVRQPLQRVSDVANKVESATHGPTTGPSQEVTPAPVQAAPSLTSRFVGAAQRALTGVVEVLLLLYLLLASGDHFVQKLIKIIPLRADKQNALRIVDESQSVVMRYLLVTLLINIGQGVIVGLVMWWLKLPSPLLWGLFTVVLEFIPYLGATVMVALLSIMAFATLDSLAHILAVPGSYLLITTIQNNIVSPYAYGKHLKLNPVAVLIGVLLWWFLWGVPGAFLAVPIIATVKIIADKTETLKPVGEFLG